MNKNLKFVISILLVLLIGIFIGYKIQQAKYATKIDEMQKKIETKEKSSVNTSLNSLLNELKANPKNINIMAKILGNHEICEKNYIKYQEQFWQKNDIDEKEINISDFILNPFSNCNELFFIEFKPNNDLILNNIKPSCISSHNSETSCYPKTMFRYLSVLEKAGLKLYITKGKRTLQINGVPKDLTIVMFKLVDPKGLLPTTYYDIVDDPSILYDPTGNTECL